MKKGKQGKKRNIKFFIALCCIVCFLCGFTFRGSITTAHADSDSVETNIPVKGGSMDVETQNSPACKYYTSIVVETGDSLYSIASKYYTEDYDSLENYIHEIKKVNGIRSDYICQGSYLTIPYYGKV